MDEDGLSQPIEFYDLSLLYSFFLIENDKTFLKAYF
jgi:hypothetical protein